MDGNYNLIYVTYTYFVAELIYLVIAVPCVNRSTSTSHIANELVEPVHYVGI